MPAARYRRHLILVFIAAAIVYLIGNSAVTLWDRDEPRYAQASRQMLRSGDWVVPRFLDEVRTAKPPLIYWCQASAMKLFGENSAAARLPSSVAILLTLFALAMILPRAVGRRRTLWTVFILATSGLIIAAAKICLTDAVLLLWITIAQACWYLALNRRANWMTWIVMGIAVGLAGLTKGPVVLGVLATTWIANRILNRFVTDAKTQAAKSGNFWRAIVCAAIVLLIVLPWMILIEQRSPGFLSTTFRHDIVARATSGLEGHKLPPGFYLLTIWITFLPWSILLPATILFAWKRRRDPLIGFCLAGVIGPWLMFEIVQTKLPLYLLPIFPPLSLLTARMICSKNRTARFRRTAIASGIIMLALVFIGYGLVLPHVQVLRTSPRVASILKNENAIHRGDVIMIDYKEPTLAFYQGGTIREESDNRFLEHVDPSSWPRWIVLTRAIWDGMPPNLRERLVIVDTVRGWWYAKNRKMVDVLVVRKR